MSYRNLVASMFARAMAAGSALWLVTAGTVACGDATPELETDAAPVADAAPRGRISVSATDGELILPFGIHVSGQGSLRVDEIYVLDASGQFQIEDQLTDVVVYQRVDWPDIDRQLYQTLAVTPDRLYVLWFYCAGSQLDQLWVEGTDGTRLAYEAASGTCSYTPEPSSRQLQLPAIAMDWPANPSACRFDGAELELDGGGPGRATIDGVDMVLLPFERVDCGACEPDGWYELHALLWDQTAQRLCFGIFYMWPDLPDSVRLDYVFCLPDLQPIEPTTFSASWTHP